MTFGRPAPNELFKVTAAPLWPVIVFETDMAGPHEWEWTISWGVFSASGLETTSSNTWNAGAAVANRGGELTVMATAGGSTATTTVSVRGANPVEADVTAYLATKVGADGFGRIIKHESAFKHFKSTGLPQRSFDNGYGMCQLTNPAPTFEQAWNWQFNVDGGLALFAAKQTAARTYLGQSGRAFTETQLKFESVCRWNGGSYHRWDTAASRWKRAPTILCDSRTGNIGWDMTDPQNAGKTETQLHARDSAGYSKPPGPGAHWRYFGACYADRVLATSALRMQRLSRTTGRPRDRG